MKLALRKIFGIVGTTLMIGQSAGLAAFADEAGGDSGAEHHCHHHDTGCSSSSSTPINLDLSSTAQSVTANHIANPVNINVGGANMAVTQGMALTPAQMIAAYQMARTGEQSLLIGSDGAAIGGSFILGSRLANHISGLVIPTGVSVINRSADLNLAGNLTNAGNIFAVSNNSAITTATISAANILNGQGALLSTILPTTLGLDLSQYSSVLNLSLSAINNIINYGTITSSGNLTATAGGSIQNLLASPGASAPVMQAMAAMNLQAPQIINQGQIISQLNSVNLATSSLVNTGIIQALAGAVNIAGLTSNVLNVNNISGEIIARDAIAMTTTATLFNEDGSVLKKAGIDLNGGILTAPELSFTSPDGVVKLDSDRLNGAVHIDGGIAEVHVKGGDLNIASLQLTGDPIFTNSNGNIAISDFDAGGTPSDFIVLATGNITANGGGASIATSGGNIVLSAGYLFTGVDSNCTSCSGLYTISRTASDTGGSINLSGSGLDASGVAGAAGTNASGTTPATAGGNGGNGGTMTIQATGSVAISGVSSNGGGGGVGGSGNNALVANNGADGGSAGNGGTINIYSGGNVTLDSSYANGGTAGNGGERRSYARAGRQWR